MQYKCTGEGLCEVELHFRYIQSNRKDAYHCVCVCVSMWLCAKCSDCAVLCNNLRDRLLPLMARHVRSVSSAHSGPVFVAQQSTTISKHRTQITACTWYHASACPNKEDILNSHYACLE